MNKAEEIYRAHLARAIDVPNRRTSDYAQLLERMVEKEDIGAFVFYVGPMDQEEIQAVMGLDDSAAAEAAYRAVQEYIDESGVLFNDFDRKMQKLDKQLLNELNSAVR